MVNIDMFFSQPSHFQAVWEGPETEEAIEFAQKHKIPYYLRSNFIMVQKHEPSGGVIEGAGHVNFPILRAANQAYNEEIRKKHETDRELDTGTDVKTISTKWFMLTRGQKLRTIAWQRNMYLDEISITNERRNACFEAVGKAGRV